MTHLESFTYASKTDETTRYRVDIHHDFDALDPTEYLEEPVTVLAAGYYSTHDVGFDSFALSEALERMNGDRSPYGGSQGLSSSWTKREIEHQENLVYAVNRYAALAGLSERVYMFEHVGYSQSDWATVMVEAYSEEGARSTFNAWSGWAKGDVYGAELVIEKYDADAAGWYDEHEPEAIWGIGGFESDYDKVADYFLNEYVPTEYTQDMER